MAGEQLQHSARHGSGAHRPEGMQRVGTLAAHVGTAHERLHFCGEHTAISNRGMEGAMESGERVAFEVLNAL